MDFSAEKKRKKILPYHGQLIWQQMRHNTAVMPNKYCQETAEILPVYCGIYSLNLARTWLYSFSKVVGWRCVNLQWLAVFCGSMADLSSGGVAVHELVVKLACKKTVETLSVNWQ